MKITTLLLLISIMTVSAGTLAQKITLDEQHASLEQVLRQIRQQSGFDFVCSENLLKQANPVTVHLKDATLDEALKASLKDQPLDYDIQDGTIVFKSKEETLVSKVKALLAQVTITGKITNETGEPLLGVTVRIKNSQQATTTDKNGNYTITVSDANTVVVFSFVGYEAVELQAKNITNNSTMQLKASSTNLKEVTVNQGYYSRKQELNTGNVARVSGEDIQKQPVTDPLLALEGRVAGLVINQSSGVPGAYSTVRLRGQNSMANGLDPFYVIDGVPYSNVTLSSSYIGGIFGTVFTRPGNAPLNNGAGLSPFNFLNPSDIENIEVLKDADATAIYGSRGANGVILITTKKGKIGPLKISANVYSGFGHVTNTVKLLNTQQYLEMRHEAFKNDGATPDPNVDFDLTYWDTTRYTNWQKLLIGNTAHFTNSNLSFSGGNDNVQYFLSGGYSDQGTVFPGAFGDKKASGHASISSNSLDKRFRLQFSADYTSDNNFMPRTDLTSNIFISPNAPAPYNSDGSLNWSERAGGSTFYDNPFAPLLNYIKSNTTRFGTNLNLNYELISGLHLQTNFGYTTSTMNQLSPIFMASLPPENYNFSQFRINSTATGSNNSWIVEPQLNYRRIFGKGVLEILAGGTSQQSVTSSLTLSGNNFTSDLLVPNIQFASSKISVQNYTNVYRYKALFARLGYTYDNKYLFNLTARRDGSSRFGPGSQFGNFGAIATGWIFSNEDFVKKQFAWLSFGKLRASYGTVGNDQLADYKFLDTYSASSTGSYQGISGLQATQITNPYFAWERMKKLEVGMELGFFRDRVNTSFSYYLNKTNNQLVSYSLPSLTGFHSIQANLPAVIENKGWEFTVNSANIQSKGFSWHTNVNVSIERNKLVSYPDIENSPYATQYQVGSPLTVRYVYHYLGVDSQTGLYTFATKNGTSSDPQYGDQIFSKGLSPTFYGGLQNTFTYNRFQLDFSFQFVKQLGRNFIASLPNAPGLFEGNQPVSILNRWKNPGNQASVQQYSQGFGNTFTAYSDFQQSDGTITDASFVRLKNLSLSYEIGGEWMAKFHVHSARLFFQGQNLVTLTNYIGLDPETQGVTLPPLRMFTFGCQISL